MANREENLKKISDELEKLSDGDLERISGGDCYETANDSRFLNVLLQGTKYPQCDRYGATRLFFEPNLASDIKKAWRALGVRINLCCTTLHDNEYYISGYQVSQAEAWAHAEKVVGRHLNQSDWDW